jgi:tetratricopeptide (TPR) repeat protein
MSKQNVTRMVELARDHVENGGIRAAEVYYRMILKATDPPASGLERMACGEANRFFAARAIANGRHGEACDWYQRAVFADPLFVDYRVEFIVRALLPMNMFKNAKIEATTATRIEPDNKDAWRAMAICCAALGEVEESAAAYDRQVELDPDNPLAKIDRSTLAINVGDYDTARKMALAVLETDKKGEALHTLALIAYREGRHEDAIDLYQRTLAEGSQDPAQVRWNMSLAMHAIGRYAEGWAESENRGRQKADEPMRIVMNRFNQPMMTREDLKTPCRLHVHNEMGNGDAIATARYLAELIDLGHDVRLETIDSLVGLLARSFPKVKVIPRALDYPGAIGVAPFDRHVPTLSLPYLFGTTIETVPWRGPYIKPDPARAARYAARLAGGGLKIGFCWSSGIRTDGLWISRYGKRKSMHFDDIVSAMPSDAVCVSLQVGPERAQQSGSRMIDLLPKKPDWDDTAALIANLDLVITVDTAVAHLAGAMGKPVWVLMQRDGASWHFMCYRDGAPWNEASPWYPSARIFRQRIEGSWSEVISDIAKEIQTHVEVGSPNDASHRRAGRDSGALRMV